MFYFPLFCLLRNSMCSFIHSFIIILMPSVRIYTVNSHENKEEPLNEEVCLNVWLVVYLQITSPSAFICKNASGVLHHVDPQMLLPTIEVWGSGGTGLKTMKVLWLFILSLLWVSRSITKEKDTSSHSRDLSRFFSLDTQHVNERHVGIHTQIMYAVHLTRNASSLFVNWLAFSEDTHIHTRTHA